MNESILRVENLEKLFIKPGIFNRRHDNAVKAIDGISFHVSENETLGLVGESGCGKTTTGKSILRLTSINNGEIYFRDQVISGMKEKQFRPYRQHMQMIFQDLDAALNPKMSIREILAETIRLYQPELDKLLVNKRLGELMELVNLKATKLNSLPNDLSGGEKRRVGIARTLAVRPSFIVADEPTSALDVSIQAQVINLMRELQQELGLSYLFISHDLPLVEIVSHRIAVMYQGRIVESGPSSKIARSPKHPYTAMLWSSINHDKQSKEMNLRTLDVTRPEQGCRFAPRCPVYLESGRPSQCRENEPMIESSRNLEHRVACHFPL